MATTRKHSRKRDAILQCLRETTEHPTAEWIFSKLKPQLPDLSLGTVYRNLTLFKEEGTIESVGTVGGLERFDGCTEPHAHFICTNCETVSDLGPIELPQAVPMLDPEAQLSGCRLCYFGLCSKCK
ncbi:MAG: transcriptional repressor [Oscillospiraceae bacterium]|nr:transcriptional repressor [Oscillospiraceae bacterium]